MINEIQKFKTDDGFEFDSKNAAQNHLDTRVDKHGVFIKMGDLVKESWNFHGFGYGLGNTTKIDGIEYVNNDKAFRFIEMQTGLKFDIDRVRGQGWPVSGYEVEIVTSDYIKSIRENPDYINTENKPHSRKPFYFRKRNQWDE